MKICIKCKKEKPLTDFNLNKSRKDGYHSCCKMCKADYMVSHYKKNKVLYLKRARERDKKLKEFVNSYKKEHPCIKCGETRYYCLDFHHNGEKEATINYMVSFGASIKRISEEMDKCDILCSNCHREFHWKEKNGVVEQLASSAVSKTV